MTKSYLLGAAASALAGALAGGVLVLSVTLAVQQTSRPPIDRSSNKDSSLLNHVEYGTR